MLEAMRRNTKVILWITVIFFVLLIFLVWGADLQFGGAPTPNTLGRVNGEAISVTEYQQELARNREIARAQGRELQPSDELIIEEQSWNSIVERKLLYQEARRRDLTARDSEVRSVLLNDPPPFITQDPSFRTEDGKFDFASYRALIQDPTVPEGILIQLENQVRSYLPLQKLQNIILASAKVTDDEVRRQFIEEYDKAVVSYVLVDAARAQVDQTVTDEQLETYFKEHRDDYRLPRRVDLTYLTIPRRATAEDTLSLRNDLAEMAKEARQAEKLQTEGQENLSYSNFETLAMSFSDAPNAEQGGLSDGYLTATEMSPAMARAAADLPAGGISEPFRDGNALHILQVVDRKQQNGEPATQIRDISMRIVPSDSTVTANRELLENVRRDAATHGLAAAAEAVGLQTAQANDVTPTGVVPGLSAVPQIAVFAQQNPPGTLSRVYDTNNAWFLVEVGEAKEEGVPPLDAVRDRVTNDILRDRRFDATLDVADRVEGRLKLGETLEQAAEAEGLQVTTGVEASRRTGVAGIGRDADVLGAVLSLNAGEVTQPVRATRGWVVLRVDDRPEMDWTVFEAQKEQVRNSLLQRKQNQIYNSWVEGLKRDAKIEDFRS
jgi:peptidyl-prolyl cis-trans isomerase D